MGLLSVHASTWLSCACASALVRLRCDVLFIRKQKYGSSHKYATKKQRKVMILAQCVPTRWMREWRGRGTVRACGAECGVRVRSACGAKGGIPEWSTRDLDSLQATDCIQSPRARARASCGPPCVPSARPKRARRVPFRWPHPLGLDGPCKPLRRSALLITEYKHSYMEWDFTE